MKNKKDKYYKISIVIIVLICFIIAVPSVKSGNGTLTSPIDPRDIWFAIDKPIARFSLLVTDTYTGEVREYNPYTGNNLTVYGEPMRKLYVRLGRDQVQMKNLSTSAGNPISKLDMQVHSANYPGGEDLRLINYKNFPYSDLENINIPSKGEYNVYLSAVGTNTLAFYNSVNGQHRALKLNANGKYYYWYFVQMEIIAVQEPQLPAAIISDSVTGDPITNLNVNEGCTIGISGIKSNFPVYANDKYYTWEIRKANSQSWTVIQDNVKNNPVPNIPMQQLGGYKIRLTVHYNPYEFDGNTPYDYWSFSRNALYNSKEIDLIIVPANLWIDLNLSCTPYESKLSEGQIINNQLVSVHVTGTATLHGFSGPNTLIEEWKLWFRKDTPPDNNLQTQSSSAYYVPGIFNPLSQQYSDSRFFSVPASWVQNSGTYMERFAVRAQVKINGIWYESDLGYCTSKFTRDGITISASLTPLIARTGQEITITVNTNNFAERLEVIFPSDIYNFDPILKNTLGKISLDITPKESASNVIKYWLPLNILKTISDEDYLIKLPYKILVNAYKSNGVSASTYVTLDVKGSITNGLVTRRK